MQSADLPDPEKFHPPDGRFYLAQHLCDIAGVGCLKKLEKGLGEMQRMYVLPSFRGKGIGRAIVNRLIEDAQSIGYRRLQLESMEFLEAAHYFFVRQSRSEPYCRFVYYLLCKTNTDI